MCANYNFSRPRPAPRLGLLVNSPPRRQDDEDSVFDYPMNDLSNSRQPSMSHPPRRPPFEPNVNQSNNFESNPSNNSPQVPPLDNVLGPPIEHFNFLP